MPDKNASLLGLHLYFSYITCTKVLLHKILIIPRLLNAKYEISPQKSELWAGEVAQEVKVPKPKVSMAHRLKGDIRFPQAVLLPSVGVRLLIA